jgi:FkbM family methyltransferase
MEIPVKNLCLSHYFAFKWATAGLRFSHFLWYLARLIKELEDGMYELPDGRIHNLIVTDWISLTTYQGQYEREIFKLLKQILSPGDSVLDVGANIGVFASMVDSLIGPKGKLVCVEPSNYCLSKLRETQKFLSSRVNIIPHALGDKKTILKLNSPLEPSHNGQSTLANPTWFEGPWIEQEISVTTIDNLFKNSKESFKLLKIDVEGYEPNILQGAKKSIADFCFEGLILEISPRFIGNEWLDKVWVQFENYPYRFKIGEKGFFKKNLDLVPIDLIKAKQIQIQWNLFISRSSIFN